MGCDCSSNVNPLTSDGAAMTPRNDSTLALLKEPVSLLGFGYRNVGEGCL